MESRFRSGLPGLVCKLGIKKAYDHVNRNFLLYLLRRMGFGGRWCRWIRRGTSTTRFSILINGVPEGFFSSSRGLRQDDPLSPFLFIVVMEAFSRMMGKVVQNGWIRGFTLGSSDPNRVTVSHLLFADDAITFCDAERRQVGALKAFFICFETVSGLKVNAGKCEMLPIGSVDEAEGLAGIMGL